MAHIFALICATFTPGTRRSMSGRLSAPDRRISSSVTTVIAAAVCEILCDFFATEVTSMFIRSSRLWSASSFVLACARASGAVEISRYPKHSARRSIASEGHLLLCAGIQLSLHLERSSTPAEERDSRDPNLANSGVSVHAVKDCRCRGVGRQLVLPKRFYIGKFLRILEFNRVRPMRQHSFFRQPVA